MVTYCYTIARVLWVVSRVLICYYIIASVFWMVARALTGVARMVTYCCTIARVFGWLLGH